MYCRSIENMSVCLKCSSNNQLTQWHPLVTRFVSSSFYYLNADEGWAGKRADRFRKRNKKGEDKPGKEVKKNTQFKLYLSRRRHVAWFLLRLKFSSLEILDQVLAGIKSVCVRTIRLTGLC